MRPECSKRYPYESPPCSCRCGVTVKALIVYGLSGSSLMNSIFAPSCSNVTGKPAFCSCERAADRAADVVEHLVGDVWREIQSRHAGGRGAAQIVEPPIGNFDGEGPICRNAKSLPKFSVDLGQSK